MEVIGQPIPPKSSSNVSETIHADHEDSKTELNIHEKIREGPQVTVSNNKLQYHTDVGIKMTSCVTVKNVGTTTVYCTWINNGKHKSKHKDTRKRFSCTETKAILLPSHSKTFYFTFQSDTHGVGDIYYNFILMIINKDFL